MIFSALITECLKIRSSDLLMTRVNRKGKASPLKVRVRPLKLPVRGRGVREQGYAWHGFSRHSVDERSVDRAGELAVFGTLDVASFKKGDKARRWYRFFFFLARNAGPGNLLR